METGEKICDVPCTAPTFTLAWHPRKHILAFACDDKVSVVVSLNRSLEAQMQTTTAYCTALIS